jgi:molybdenum cofactor cytidylyltransferase
LIGAILLAAGSSRRFGTDKLLASLPDGTPIAVAAASTLVKTLPRVVAVVRPESDMLASALRSCGTEVVVCPHADDGMGSSLAWGVAAAGDWDGWVVALADMPWVTAATVQAVAAAVAEGAWLSAPRYRGTRGHPVCFGARQRAALLALRGDRGGRTLLEAAGDSVHYIECDDPGVLADIDTPADLERLTLHGGTGTRQQLSK